MIDEYNAFKAALGEGGLTGKVYDTARLDSNGNFVRAAYVILYGGAPDRLTDDRLTAAPRPTSRATYVYTVRAVAPDTAGVIATANVAVNNLVGRVLTITGRRCAPITLEVGADVRDDDSVTPPLLFADLEFQLISAPA